MKRLFKKLSRRKIATFTLMIVVFVMCLGYAALSQYIEIEGMALIDRSWIVKISNVDVAVTNDGVNNSNTFVGSTVTFNASLPKATSTVTYNITVENKGNLKAKLHSIEKIEDDNANITYTISGVTEGETTLNPGETNVITVTIKVKDGVTNLSDTEKSVMLSFNYVENSINQNGGTSVEIYDKYFIGETVTLRDNSIWHVVKNSGDSQEYITLLANDSVGTYAFDTTAGVIYDLESQTNLGYVLNNTVLPQITNTITQNGGNTTGTTIRLLTRDEYDDLVRMGKQHLISETWMMPDSTNTSKVYYYTTEITEKTASETGTVRPVIITLKSNIKPGVTLVSQILSHNTAYADNVASPYVTASTGIDFSKISSDTNGKGLYYTSTNTENNKTTYYFRGNVQNNIVKFGKETITTGMCTYNGEPLWGYDGASDFAPEEISESDCENNYVCVVEYYDEETGEYEYDYTLIIGSEYSFCEEWGGYEDTLGNYVTETSEEDMYWRIIRINEDGTTRMIYQGNSATANESIGTSAFNTTAYDNAHIGYMYGENLTSSYELTHANKNNSTIKTYIDNWYSTKTNLPAYLNTHLADSGFCNDRSIGFEGEGYNDSSTYYRADSGLPQFVCPQTNDLFTTNASSKGNKALTHPIGLLTADEAGYAGGLLYTSSNANANYYLYTGYKYWTMTPMNFIGGMNDVNIAMVESDGGYSSTLASETLNVRPVINLQAKVEIAKGTGTVDNPYIIK